MAPRPEWLTAALEHQRAGRFVEAERIYNGVLRADPAEADALHLLGLIAASGDHLLCRQRSASAALPNGPSAIQIAISAGHIARPLGFRWDRRGHFRRHW